MVFLTRPSIKKGAKGLYSFSFWAGRDITACSPSGMATSRIPKTERVETFCPFLYGRARQEYHWSGLMMSPNFSEVLSMKPETAEKVKYGVWGLILGAVIAMTIGFQWGGWSTRGTSQEMTDAALLTTRAAICVAQFIKDPNYKARLKEMKALMSWQRTEFIEKGGWDKMPGEEKGSYIVSRACADGLEVLLGK